MSTTMAKGRRGGGWGRSGVENLHPRTVSCSTPSAAPQEMAVAAGDHRGAALDEADDRVTHRRCLPRLGGDPVAIVERGRDLAVARTAAAPVRRLQHQPKPPALRCGDPWLTERRQAAAGAPEADQCLDAIGKIVVEWHENRERVFHRGAARKQQHRGKQADAQERVEPLGAVT